MTTTEQPATEAAEPITSATEPAASNDETQSVYAWSHADDDDTELIRRRSWKLPVTFAAVAVAAATAVGALTVWPHHSTPKNPAAVAAPPAVMPAPSAAPLPPPSVDDQFLAALRKEGLAPPDPHDPQLIATNRKAAQNVCEYLTAGHTPRQAVQRFGDENPQLTEQQFAVVINLTQEYYCPNA